MDRFIEKELLGWKKREGRMPLILRGARQVGKSYIIEKFGKENFENIVVVNLELNPEFVACFTEGPLDPQEIVKKLEALTKQSIREEQTLLFIDEIQYCPRAITALRYFKELMPKLHVISAGSLIEFTLNDNAFSFPVGRIQFMYLKPLSFLEFLHACGYEKLIEYISEVNLENPLPETIHNQLIKLIREYFLVGGMPAVVKRYRDTQSFLECEQEQRVILDTYRNDFGKYASKAQHKYLRLLFEKAPGIIGEHFKYVKIDPEVKSRELNTALNLLNFSGLIHRIYATSATGIPLRHGFKSKKFKLLFLDIGLLQRANQVDSSVILGQDLLQVNQGALAEQFVGQELITNCHFFEEKNAYYWEREAKSSSAELDYVMNISSEVIPIEVKAGKTGKRRSLQLFMDEKKSKIGVKISQSPLSFDRRILSVPFYLINQLSRLISPESL